jgi:hypothetical protein
MYITPADLQLRIVALRQLLHRELPSVVRRFWYYTGEDMSFLP